MRVALTLEYDGYDFCGWQRQSHGGSIQECLENALATYIRSETKKHGLEQIPALPNLIASGRTDAGVHARGQVVSFSWPSEIPLDCYVLQGALNGLTPKTIAVLSVEEKPPEFHARFDAKRKCYEYRILNRLAPSTNPRYPAWHVASRLDWGAMYRVTKGFLGTHDFVAFMASDGNQKTTVRTIEVAELTTVAKNEIVFTVVGTGFLKQMVRIMVGTMVDVGIGSRTVAEVQAALCSSAGRAMAGKTAPPEGLTLSWVEY